MKIIISPARKMTVDTDTIPYRDLPVLLDSTREIFAYMRGLTYDQCHYLWWNCSEKLARKNFQLLHRVDLTKNLTPAILAFTGLQYQYMVPDVFTDHAFDYVQAHLRILSGFYGILKPLDGIVPYRLGMGDRAKVNGTANLYQFWGARLTDLLYQSPTEWVLNLASKEYSKAITKFMEPTQRMVTCVFGELRSDGRVRQATTHAKMARGQMVRYLAENNYTTISAIRHFHDGGFTYDAGRSTADKLVFIRAK